MAKREKVKATTGDIKPVSRVHIQKINGKYFISYTDEDREGIDTGPRDLGPELQRFFGYKSWEEYKSDNIEDLKKAPGELATVHPLHVAYSFDEFHDNFEASDYVVVGIPSESEAKSVGDVVYLKNLIIKRKLFFEKNGIFDQALKNPEGGLINKGTIDRLKKQFNFQELFKKEFSKEEMPIMHPGTITSMGGQIAPNAAGELINQLAGGIKEYAGPVYWLKGGFNYGHVTPHKKSFANHIFKGTPERMGFEATTLRRTADIAVERSGLLKEDAPEPGGVGGAAAQVATQRLDPEERATAETPGKIALGQITSLGTEDMVMALIKTGWPAGKELKDFSLAERKAIKNKQLIISTVWHMFKIVDPSAVSGWGDAIEDYQLFIEDPSLESTLWLTLSLAAVIPFITYLTKAAHLQDAVKAIVVAEKRLVLLDRLPEAVRRTPFVEKIAERLRSVANKKAQLVEATTFADELFEQAREMEEGLRSLTGGARSSAVRAIADLRREASRLRKLGVKAGVQLGAPGIRTGRAPRDLPPLAADADWRKLKIFGRWLAAKSAQGGDVVGALARSHMASVALAARALKAGGMRRAGQLYGLRDFDVDVENLQLYIVPKEWYKPGNWLTKKEKLLVIRNAANFRAPIPKKSRTELQEPKLEPASIRRKQEIEEAEKIVGPPEGTIEKPIPDDLTSGQAEREDEPASAAALIAGGAFGLALSGESLSYEEEQELKRVIKTSDKDQDIIVAQEMLTASREEVPVWFYDYFEEWVRLSGREKIKKQFGEVRDVLGKPSAVYAWANLSKERKKEFITLMNEGYEEEREKARLAVRNAREAQFFRTTAGQRLLLKRAIAAATEEIDQILDLPTEEIDFARKRAEFTADGLPGTGAETGILHPEYDALEAGPEQGSGVPREWLPNTQDGYERDGEYIINRDGEAVLIQTDEEGVSFKPTTDREKHEYLLTGPGGFLGVEDEEEVIEPPGVDLSGDQPDYPVPYAFIQNNLGIDRNTWDIYRNTIGQIESNNKYGLIGGGNDHYDGRYQIGAAAKAGGARHARRGGIEIPDWLPSYVVKGEPYPGHGPEQRQKFRDNPELQEKIFAGLTVANHKSLSKSSKYQNLSKFERLEILGYGHNQGASDVDPMHLVTLSTPESISKFGGKKKRKKIRSSEKRFLKTIKPYDPGATISEKPVSVSAFRWLESDKKLVGQDAFGTRGTKYSNALNKAYDSQAQGVDDLEKIRPEEAVVDRKDRDKAELKEIRALIFGHSQTGRLSKAFKKEIAEAGGITPKIKQDGVFGSYNDDRLYDEIKNIEPDNFTHAYLFLNGNPGTSKYDAGDKLRKDSKQAIIRYVVDVLKVPKENILVILPPVNLTNPRDYTLKDAIKVHKKYIAKYLELDDFEGREPGTTYENKKKEWLERVQRQTNFSKRRGDGINRAAREFFVSLGVSVHPQIASNRKEDFPDGYHVGTGTELATNSSLSILHGAEETKRRKPRSLAEILEKNRYLAAKYNWEPADFGATKFDVDLIEKIKAFQYENDLRDDGEAGEKTIAALRPDVVEPPLVAEPGAVGDQPVPEIKPEEKPEEFVGPPVLPAETAEGSKLEDYARVAAYQNPNESQDKREQRYKILADLDRKLPGRETQGRKAPDRPKQKELYGDLLSKIRDNTQVREEINSDTLALLDRFGDGEIQEQNPAAWETLGVLWAWTKIGVNQNTSTKVSNFAAAGLIDNLFRGWKQTKHRTLEKGGPIDPQTGLRPKKSGQYYYGKITKNDLKSFYRHNTRKYKLKELPYGSLDKYIQDFAGKVIPVPYGSHWSAITIQYMMRADPDFAEHSRKGGAQGQYEGGKKKGNVMGHASYIGQGNAEYWSLLKDGNNIKSGKKEIDPATYITITTKKAAKLKYEPQVGDLIIDPNGHGDVVTTRGRVGGNLGSSIRSRFDGGVTRAQNIKAKQIVTKSMFVKRRLLGLPGEIPIDVAGRGASGGLSAPNLEEAKILNTLFALIEEVKKEVENELV